MDALKIKQQFFGDRHRPDNPSLSPLECLEVDRAIAVVDALRCQRQHFGNAGTA